jgi:hypothetical protein
MDYRQIAMLVGQMQAALDGFPGPGNAVRHALPGELIVSLTSYPQRFGTLAMTLKSLLMQNRRPDRIVLWIANEDIGALPRTVTVLQDYGLTILPCDNLRSYKKILPALERFRDSFIITADDDLYYDEGWVADIAGAYDPAAPAIVCRRAHGPKREAGGCLLPYREWNWNIVMSLAVDPFTGVFPTNGGGTLFFPGSLDPEVFHREAWEKLCPMADDIWLYWMARRAGTRFLQAGGPFFLLQWGGTEGSALSAFNLNGGNDRQIRAMEKAYGPV